MKCMMSDRARGHLRGWTVKFIDDKFIPNHNDYNDHNLWLANCCTGSGKSNLSFETLIQDIANFDSDGKKSLNAIVVPTIMLARQTADALNEYMSDKYPNLRHRVLIGSKHSGVRAPDPKTGHPGDIKIDIDNKTNTCYLFDDNMPHVILVFVADSFFGSTKSATDLQTTLNYFRNSVLTAKEFGNDLVSGCVVFDEAHNYKTDFENITGYDANDVDDYAINKDKVANCVRMAFLDTMLMSGTPCQKQCYLSLHPDFRPYTVEVNYAEALGIAGNKHEPWIINPWLWVIRTFTDELSELENAIITAYMHEEVLNKMHESTANDCIHMLVNCKDIISAHDMGMHIYEAMRNNLHREVDVIILHSDKNLADTKENEPDTLVSLLNNKEIKGDAKEFVRKIDENYVGRNVIVFQVGMISEGLNVNSFNSVILTSCAEVKVVQQTGRGVRFLDPKYGIKRHTSIYAVAPNKSIVEEVICKQLIEQGLDLSEVLKGVVELERPDGGGKASEEGEFTSNGWSFNTDFQPADIATIKQKIQNIDWDATVKSGTSNPNDDILSFIEFAKAYMMLKKVGKGGSGGNGGNRGGGSGGNGGSGNGSGKGKKPKKNEWTPLKFKNQFLSDFRKKVENSDIMRSMCDTALLGNDDVLPWLIANFFMTGEKPELGKGVRKYIRGLVGKSLIEHD